MQFDTSYQLDLNSDQFVFLASRLNKTFSREDPEWYLDVFSGSYAFNDEYPREEVIFCDVDISLKLTTLMRYLWAYRLSLVEGKPRSKFAEFWEATKSLAPCWAGFATERCSSAMLPIVEQMRIKQIQFDQDVERLEARIEERTNRKRDIL